MAEPLLTIDVDLPDADSLFKDGERPMYPQRGRSLQEGLAEQLLNQTRERRITPTVTLNFRLSTRAMVPEKEAGIRSEVRNYFSVEADRAALELRVNQSEGWRSMAIALPVLIAAGLVAYPVYAYGGNSFAVSFLYLMIITVVWVMLWDPIEKLVFDPIFIRLRRNAFAKLRDASVTFQYGSSRSQDRAS